jgi:hypothetical protein
MAYILQAGSWIATDKRQRPPLEGMTCIGRV